MKKMLIALLVIFVANLGCKKTGVDGGGLCACSPVEAIRLGLVIKNANADDLLNPVTSGFLDKSKIQLYAKDAQNTAKQINFEIRKPFVVTPTVALNYYQISSAEIAALSRSIDKFYLKLGDNKPLELRLKMNANNRMVEKVTVDEVEAPREIANVNDFYLNSIYTIKIQP